jgi:transposase-like protein
MMTQLAFWTDHVKKQKELGGSIAEYARANQLSADQFYRWRHQLKQHPKKNFAKISVLPPHPSQSLLRILITNGSNQITLDGVGEDFVRSRVQQVLVCKP